MKITLFTLASCIMMTQLFAQQKMFTKTGQISFYSDAPLEKIEAQTKQATCILNTENKELAFKVLIKSFEFKKALMQEHFNENYMESDKFPESTFKGNIIQPNMLDFSKEGTHDVVVSGKLTIHGVTKDIQAKGTLSIIEGASKIKLLSNFSVLLKDYDIKNDKLQNISEKIDIKMDATLTELKK